MNRRAIQFILVLNVSIIFTASGQRPLFFVGGCELGFENVGYRFAQHGQVLKAKWLSPGNGGEDEGLFMLNLAAGLHYRYHRQWAIEGGFQLTEIALMVHDNKYLSTTVPTTEPPYNYNTNKGNDGNFRFAHLYGAPYISIFYFPGGSHFYLNGGLQYNYNAMKTHAGFTYTSPDDQHLDLEAHFSGHYIAGYLETGILFNGPIKGSFSRSGCFFGLRYYFAPQMMDASYTNTQSGKILYADQMSASGRYLSISCRYILPLPTPKFHHKRKPRRISKSENTRGF